MSFPKALRNSLISIFVVLWLGVFHYESLRVFYLNPLFGRELPKVKFLFPPAGWIMFFNVTDQYSLAEVYGIKNGKPQLIDPHLILETRPIGYDNIHRNALSVILSQDMAKPFCGYMKRKFPYFDKFIVVAVQYPHLGQNPLERNQRIWYQCP